MGKDLDARRYRSRLQPLPRYWARLLSVNIEGLEAIHTMGVGGAETVYFSPKLKVKLGEWEREIPVGFLDSNEIPPLMGRQLFFETFEVRFSKKHTVSFEE
ncbi:MAG: hypothetical protein HY376_01235 [Candidatus Blackburnbacteria bacterium]|nr:hypothetical protein [Candidatus Blackburnbacteria bacterium]